MVTASRPSASASAMAPSTMVSRLSRSRATDPLLLFAMSPTILRTWLYIRCTCFAPDSDGAEERNVRRYSTNDVASPLVGDSVRPGVDVHRVLPQERHKRDPGLLGQRGRKRRWR